MTARPSRIAPLLNEIAEQVGAALKKDGIAAPRALEVGIDVAAHLDETFAGTMLYWPKGRSEKSADKHEEIANAFNGSNIPELAVRFDMSEPSIYRVLKKMREARRKAPVMPKLSGRS
jgi:Mor family transcriptional regulator